jgi:hypothetical protein
MNPPELATVDVNVAIAANGGAPHVSAGCRASCVEMLLAIIGGGRIALDAGGLIFREYLNHLSLAGEPGTGDAFVRWVHDHQWNPETCDRVLLTPLEHGDFAEFPRDAALAAFDLADRKYAAVAKVSGATVVNATDTDWRDFAAAFRANSIAVLNLCV